LKKINKKIVKKNKNQETNANINQDTLNGISEEQFLSAIDNITKNLAYKFKFGYHEIEDMKQQIIVFALEGLKNYDHNRPLENFLWTHVRNRLFNYKRDNYQRPNKPCLSCPFYDPYLKNSSSECSKFTNKDECELYTRWFNRNNSKKKLVHFTPIEDIKDYSNIFCENNISLSNLASKEIIDLIESKLTGELRTIYLKLKNGCKVNNSDKSKLLNFIKTYISYE